MMEVRSDQAFPVFDTGEVGRLARFGKRQQYGSGEAIFTAGHVGPGMVILLEGIVSVLQRNGLNLGRLVGKQGPGQFVAEVSQLSGKPSLEDVFADCEVEAIVIGPHEMPTLIIEEADLGERITRALILRRVALVEAGVSGAVIVGSASSPAVIRLQNFLSRNGQPHHQFDPVRDQH
jgi:thioredoxin reductase (NADPH)